MTRFLFSCAFALGALAIIWVGRIFLGADTFGLGVTILIGGVYAIGAWELLVYTRSTATLNDALEQTTEHIDDLSQWLSTLDFSLRNPVRMRIGGERNGLPAPVLTPYLVGLLVMLGLLGTFIGMVDTLKGAVVALEGGSELEAIREGLAAPIEGLGLAFGTSVAGVAASAILGLLSTLSRRERLQASQLLDIKVSGELRHFSTAYQQQRTFVALQSQAQALPAVVTQLERMATNLEQMGENIGDKLLANQEQFQETVTQLHRQLNESVDQSLKTSLVESAELISSSILPMAEQTMLRLSDVALSTQAQLNKHNEQQLVVIGDALVKGSALVQDSLETSIKQQSESTESMIETVNSSAQNASNELQTSTRLLLDEFSKAGEQWVAQQNQNASVFSATISEQLTKLRDDEDRRGGVAVEKLAELQAVVTTHLASLGQALEEPMLRLIETSSRTPKAAAEVIEKLRTEMTKNFERDNDLLNERTRLMEQLDTLTAELTKNSVDQRQAVDTLIQQSGQSLSEFGSKFSEQIEGEASKLSSVVEYFASSGAEMASLGEAFSLAVNLFSESNNLLIENLNRIESSLEQSNSRSDEQLGYYVAQAREIIDYNLLSHKEIIDALRMRPKAAIANGGS